MKRNPITIITGAVLAVIFVCMLFTFQVRQTEVAVVTTFGKYSRSITNAGFQFRLPWPIQKIYEFDNRIQTFERKFDQSFTKDQISLIISVYVGWRVADPRMFLESFNGDITKAEQTLEPVVRNAKSGVIGQSAFSDLISTNQAELRFDEVETKMLDAIQAQVRRTYGIQIEILGVKRLNLPASVTRAKGKGRQKSFAPPPTDRRMKSRREPKVRLSRLPAKPRRRRRSTMKRSKKNLTSPCSGFNSKRWNPRSKSVPA